MARVDIHYFYQAMQCAVRQGYDSEAILTKLDINLPEHAHQVDDQHMTRLVQFVWATLEDEFLGCTNTPCKRGTFPFMARHIMQFQSLGQMLKQAFHFYSLVTDDVKMSLTEKGDNAEIEFSFPCRRRDPGYFFCEFWLIIWHRFSSWLIDEKIPLTLVSFDYAKPQHHQQLKLLFPCRHRFGSSSVKLCFLAKYLELPCARTQAQLTQFLHRSPADLITIPGGDSSVKSMIRAELLNQNGLELYCPTLEALAASLNISAQTLRRRLRVEGTSYPQIKDEIRLDLALEYLTGGKLTIAQIAIKLGFSEPRSFTRAFKHWTGVSPSKYRLGDGIAQI